MRTSAAPSTPSTLELTARAVATAETQLGVGGTTASTTGGAPGCESFPAASERSLTWAGSSSLRRKRLTRLSETESVAICISTIGRKASGRRMMASSERAGSTVAARSSLPAPA
eukprot:3963530-Prymnesium_polylepis.1